MKSPAIPQLPKHRELLSSLSPYHSKLVGESYLARKRPVYECTDVQVCFSLTITFPHDLKMEALLVCFFFDQKNLLETSKTIVAFIACHCIWNLDKESYSIVRSHIAITWIFYFPLQRWWQWLYRALPSPVNFLIILVKLNCWDCIWWWMWQHWLW